MSGQRGIQSFFNTSAQGSTQPPKPQSPPRPDPQDSEQLPDAWLGPNRLPQVEDVANYGLRRTAEGTRTKRPSQSVAQLEELPDSRPSTSGSLLPSEAPTSQQTFVPDPDDNQYSSDPIDWDEYENRNVRQVLNIVTGEWEECLGGEDEYDEVRIEGIMIRLSDEKLGSDEYARETKALQWEEARRQVCRSRAACLEILGKVKKHQPADGWCVLADMKPSKEGGYIQVSYHGYNKLITLQEVVLGAAGMQLGADIEGQRWEQASHLCCKPTCTTVGHVTVESHEDNGKRKNCQVWIECPHCKGKGEVKAILTCPHAPTCVKHHAGYKSHEAFLHNGVCAVSREAFITGQYNDGFNALTGLKR